MAMDPPSTHHSHLEPSDLRLRLTSISSYGSKYRSVANPTFNPKEKGREHTTKSGSCYRRDPSAEDSTDSSPEQVARTETLEDLSTERGCLSFVPENETPGRLSLDILLQNDLPRGKNLDIRYPRPSRRQSYLPIFECLNAVVSTYHLKMKFPMEHGIGEVKGNQTTARQCYMASCRLKNKEALIIEDLREDTKMQRAKPVEELVSIEVYPGKKNKTVRIGSNIKEDTKLELVNLLRTYADVFAWTAADIPGIDPKNLYVDGSSAIGSSGAGIILISPEGFVVEYALRFGFQASNNEVEYEALLAGIRLAHALKVDSLSVNSDSQLVVNHVLGDYEARDERMAQYLQLVKTSASKFKNFTFRQIPRDQNTQVDTLSRLASVEVTDV
ncbi:hypothetical protein RJ639_026696 [Escallonia herrerae]|uniref:RNase H type-1 domain-containing protein n=1 Tax=Escallonia herrerae TaxID=1293975 RepID=A0AA88X3N2_9ASTE|nr:hypothetical protein RJ639_026696 [Escallonia herrerae]